MINTHFRSFSAAQFTALVGGTAAISAVEVGQIGSDHILHVFGLPQDGLPGTDLGGPSTWPLVLFEAVFECEIITAEGERQTVKMDAVPDGALVLNPGTPLAPNTFS